MADCLKPQKKCPLSKVPYKIDGGLNEANLAKILQSSNTSKEGSNSSFDGDFTFVVTITILSQVLVANLSKDTWIVNSSVSKHMIDYFKWFISI